MNTPRDSQESHDRVSVGLIDGGLAFATNSPDTRNSYHPSLSILSQTEWFVSYDLGTSTESLDYHTRALRTYDTGKTWTDGGRLISPVEGRPTTHTIRTRLISPGRILGFGKWEEREGYETQRSNRDTLGQVPMRLFWIESADGGRSWSPPRWMEPPLVGPTWELCHPILRLPDDSWAAPAATWRAWNGDLPNGELTGMLVSSDGGQTWPRFVVSFDGREGGLIHWEQSVVVRDDGTLVATAWRYDPRRRETLPSVFARSEDGGTSFQPPRPTGFYAQTCKIVEIGAGRLLAVYRRHDRSGLWVELATVDHHGWRTERRGLLWDGANSGMEGRRPAAEELNNLRFGYPSAAVLLDRSVVVVFWGTYGDRTGIHWVRFNCESIPPYSPGPEGKP